MHENYISTLPNDDVRSIMWRFSERFDLQMLAQSARAVARGPVAKAVSQGERNTHKWTETKNNILKSFDESGITSFFMGPEHGGYIEGPKNMASALVAYELAWVDSGAATCSLAGNLALEPIHERGTEEQKSKYLTGATPPQPGENRKQLRGSFCLTEPLPYVGVETGILSGKMRVAEWADAGEPLIQVEKRGRFITNMGFANFACLAVESDDPKIKGSCMIILEDTDPGTFDPGAPTLKLVHQLSNTHDPIFNMKVPANRIIGGYTIQDGVIIPNYSHGEVIEAVFKRTRVTVALMPSAKLLSAVEPIIRYQRTRFRGGGAEPGNPRYDLGLQQKEDTLQKLATIWATGEASASLGFTSARICDEYDLYEKEKDRIFKEQGVKKGRSELKALMQPQKDAIKFIEQSSSSNDRPQDTLTCYALLDSMINVLCPASKLWSTGYGATILREAVALMGGYGITEDCPGFLTQKWVDTQLEATYEGPECVQRRQLSISMTSPVFLAVLKKWKDELKQISEMGANSIADAIDLWMWTLNYLQKTNDDNGSKLYSSSRQGVTFVMADALSWLLASTFQIFDTKELKDKGPANPALVDAIDGLTTFFSDLSALQASRCVGEVSRICTESFYGYTSNIPDLQGEFLQLKNQAESATRGLGLQKDRASAALTKIMIPEALDYPV